MTLDELPIGKTATVSVVGGNGELRQHFLDMGIIPTTDITMVKYAPMGDPVEVRIKSYELSLRIADAKQIEIRDVREGLDAAHGAGNRNKQTGGEKSLRGRRRETGITFGRLCLTRDLVKAESTMSKRMSIRFRMVPS